MKKAGVGEQICVNKKEYCGKILIFKKGKKLSWHFHHEKDEVFFLMHGKLILRIALDDNLLKAEEFILNEGECFHVFPYLRHQMEALEASKLIEFSTFHKEKDSIRIIKGD